MPRLFVSLLAQAINAQNCWSGIPLEVSDRVLPQGQLANVTIPIGFNGRQLPKMASYGMADPKWVVASKYFRKVSKRRPQLLQYFGKRPSTCSRIWRMTSASFTIPFQVISRLLVYFL